MTAAEDAAQLVSLLAPLLVVVLVAAVIASAWRDGAVRGVEVHVDERAAEWAQYVFGSEAVEFGKTSSLAAAFDAGHG